MNIIRSAGLFLSRCVSTVIALPIAFFIIMAVEVQDLLRGK